MRFFFLQTQRPTLEHSQIHSQQVGDCEFHAQLKVLGALGQKSMVAHRHWTDGARTNWLSGNIFNINSGPSSKYKARWLSKVDFSVIKSHFRNESRSI